MAYYCRDNQNRCMSISDRIKAIRESKKIRQSDIARALGIEPTNYPRLENRGNKLSFEQLEAIAGVLEVSVLDILTWGESKELEKEEAKEVAQLQKENEELKKRMKELESLNTAYEKYINTLSNNFTFQFNQIFEDAAERFDYGVLIKIEDAELDKLALEDSKELPEGEYMVYENFIRQLSADDIDKLIGAICNVEPELYQVAVSLLNQNVIIEPNIYATALRKYSSQNSGFKRFYVDKGKKSKPKAKR